jgi:hypothetical protein
MGAKQSSSKGFTLIAALLLLLLLSGIAVGLMYMTNTEARVGGNDLENNLAYYGGEAGMEKMTSDLGNLYASNQAPSVNNIKNLANFPPQQMPGITYTEYTFDVPVDAKGNLAYNIGAVKAGPNQGLIAEVVPMTLSVTSQRLSGAQVRMQRTVEVALVPVFQFGVFSDSDLSYFAGPAFDFAGRVHTNGNLFLAESDTGTGLIFHDKLTAAKEVIRDKLANGEDVKGQGRLGPVYIPNTPKGCDNAQGTASCIDLSLNKQYESYIGGPPPNGNPNNNWSNISVLDPTLYQGYIRSGGTGVAPLQLPFVGNGVGPIEIIRKPPANEVAGSQLSGSRLFTKAAIRVLLADTESELIQGTTAGLGDADNVRLDNQPTSNYPAGIAVDGVAGQSYFAYGSNKIGDLYFDPNSEQRPPIAGPFAGLLEWPLLETARANPVAAHVSYLRVEARKADGTWIGVTREWLQHGFARDLTPPTCPTGGGACSNDIHKNAILILQQVADRDNNGVISGGKESKNSGSRYNWYPINLYDPREGEVRDTNVAPKTQTSCAPNGVMNMVELDTGNLREWLLGNMGGNGALVDWATQNGYVLYFSDRRGAQPNPNSTPPNLVTGEYGFEDNINAANVNGTPDGVADSYAPPYSQSAEDVDQNNLLDKWGAQYVGDAFGINTRVSYDPFTTRIPTCSTVGRKNQVTGPRHALKLVDGKLGHLPTRPDGTGGFTVASENPVYIQGDYNANGGFGAGNAAAAVIADAVTLLSNQWSDAGSLNNPIKPGTDICVAPVPSCSRKATVPTWYRLAIAAGKNANFKKPAWDAGATSDNGTDGGVHNFLRYVESWGTDLNYLGSIVSLYYSQYDTGIFKCCTTVYSPPHRVYKFDTLFLDPTKLPPGTPTFQDIDNVSYRQDFKPY